MPALSDNSTDGRSRVLVTGATGYIGWGIDFMTSGNSCAGSSRELGSEGTIDPL